MNASEPLGPSIKLRVMFGILGGLLGALNPAWFLFKPSYAKYIVERWGFDYIPYASMFAGFFILLLFVPAMLSTIVLYPWFFRRVHSRVLQGRTGILSNIVSGLVFGCAASILTAFFFIIAASLFNITTGRFEAFQAFVVVLTGPFILGLSGIVISLPGMIVTGWIFSTATQCVARRIA